MLGAERSWLEQRRTDRGRRRDRDRPGQRQLPGRARQRTRGVVPYLGEDEDALYQNFAGRQGQGGNVAL